MRRYGDGFWRLGIGNRFGGERSIVGGESESIITVRWYRWMGLIMLGLSRELPDAS
jgi:hypothetical protein